MIASHVADLPEFEPLRDLELVAMTKDKYNAEDELVFGSPAVDAKVVPEIWKATFTSDTDYLLLVDGYTWEKADASEQETLVHTLLMKIDVQETDKGTKLKIRKPDIVAFSTTARRYGTRLHEADTLQRILQNAGADLLERVAEVSAE